VASNWTSQIGIKIQSAQVEINTIFARLRRADNDPNRGIGIVVQPLRINLTGNTHLAFTVLFSAVVFVLLIACSNVANLLLARGSAREREIAIRAALGANRTRIVRQLFTENALLAAMSGCLGLILSSLGVKGLIALAPSDIPRIHEASLDGGVLAFSSGISFIAAALFGLVPAWRMVDTIQPLKSVGAGMAANLAVKRGHGFFVIAEFAIATVLLVGTGLLVRSFVAIESVDPGFAAEQILTMNISLPGETPERTSDSYNTVLERVRGIPGVQAAGAVDSLLDLGKISNLGLRSIEGRSPEPEERWTPLRWTAVRGDYFQAMGICRTVISLLMAWSVAKRIVALTEGQTAMKKPRPMATPSNPLSENRIRGHEHTAACDPCGAQWREGRCSHSI
jgi:putative ABC transport system permease protein